MPRPPRLALALPLPTCSWEVALTPAALPFSGAGASELRPQQGCGREGYAAGPPGSQAVLCEAVANPPHSGRREGPYQGEVEEGNLHAALASLLCALPLTGRDPLASCGSGRTSQQVGRCRALQARQLHKAVQERAVLKPFSPAILSRYPFAGEAGISFPLACHVRLHSMCRVRKRTRVRARRGSPHAGFAERPDAESCFDCVLCLH